MPIEDQARGRESSLSRFLKAQLPHLSEIEAEWAQQMGAASSPECGLAYGWDVVGSALELRIGLDLGHAPAPERLLTYLPHDRYSELLAAVGFGPGPVNEERALATCLNLMDVAGLAHKHTNWSVDRRRAWFMAVVELGPLGDDQGLLEAIWLAWKTYVDQGRAKFHELGSRVAISPALAGGFGIADLVVGDTLVEIKLTRDTEAPVDRWLRQVLGYLLLDWDDLLRVERVAVYAAWQGQMLTCSVDRLLDATRRGSVRSLTEIRDCFRMTMREELKSFTRREFRSGG